MNRQLENDSRLTAYALGELIGDDAAAVETLLAASPEARAEVAAIREAATSIRGAMGATGTAGLALSDVGRAAILDSAAAAEPARIIRHRLLRWGMTLTAAAASLAFVATLWRPIGTQQTFHQVNNQVAFDALADESHVRSLRVDPTVRELYFAAQPDGSVPYLIHGRNPSLPRPILSNGVKSFDVSVGQNVGVVGGLTSAGPPAAPRFSEPADKQPVELPPIRGRVLAMLDDRTPSMKLATNPQPTNDAYFGRSTTHYTLDLQGSSGAPAWTGDDRSAWQYTAGKPTQPLKVRTFRKFGGDRDPNSTAYLHNQNVPSSGDTLADLRHVEGDIPLLPNVFGHETMMSSGTPEQIAAIKSVLDALLEADEALIPWHQDVLCHTNWRETASSAPATLTRDDLRGRYAAELESKDIAALQAAASDLYRARQYDEAAQIIGLALEIEPNNERLIHLQGTYEDRANLANQVDLRQEAIERLEERRAILNRQRIEKINGLYQLAEQLRRGGEFAGAASAVEQVRLLDPQNPSIETTLTQIQQEDRASRDNPFLESLCRPLSTFSIDVDTAAYSLVRQSLAAGQLPSPESVRIEELINYFDYDYPPPTDDRPFAANLEIAACPWQPAHRLVRVALKGQVVQAEQRPVANLVFLIDVSGSMNEPAKLPMVKNSLRMLVDQLWDDDRVAIVVYAGAAGLVLPSTPASQRETILAAIDNLSAGGSTDGGSGITLAYDVAAQNFLNDGINRVVLATDGDFNVGVTDRGQLETLIAERAKSGVFLTTLGYGYRNSNDKTLETLADKGNGHYAIIDSLDEAKKVLVDNVGGTLQTIAKDVKIQVEFNPATVAGYRLIGYENRILAARDFNDDTKDAGEIGAGHTVTALYEIVPIGVAVPPMGEAALAKLPPEDSLRSVLSDDGVDPLKYQTPGEWMRAILPPAETADVESSDNTADAEVGSVAMPEIMTLKLRYKLQDGNVSSKIEFAVADRDAPFDAASDDFRFAAAVAAYGMLLRNSIHAGEINMAGVAEIASAALGIDESGRRAEFVELAKRATTLLDSATNRE